MTMTDPIADMLTRLRNANQAYQESTTMPSSKIKVGIAEILKAEGYISNFELTEVEGHRRISKPGLRVYAKAKALPKVLGGLGIAIISTSQGLLTDKQANAKSVGGEVLAYVW